MDNPATMTPAEFRKALRRARNDQKAEMELKQYFLKVMEYAVNETRILDTSRMLALYPPFKESCDEQQEIDQQWSNARNDVRHPMPKVA